MPDHQIDNMPSRVFLLVSGLANLNEWIGLLKGCRSREQDCYIQNLFVHQHNLLVFPLETPIYRAKSF